MEDRDAIQPEFYGVKAFAARLGVSDKLVRKLIANNEIFARHFGRLVKIPGTELERLKSPMKATK